MTRPALSLLTCVVLIAASSSIAQPAPDTRLRVASPGGQIVFILSDAPHTRAMDPASNDLRYAIDFHRKWLMDESALGLKIEGQPSLGPGMKQVHVDTRPHGEALTPAPGEAKSARNRYNTALVDLTDNAGRKLSLQVCVFDDGVAFRYIVPAQPSIGSARIEGELTQFIYSRNATVYPFIVNPPPNASAVQSQPRAVNNLPPEWRIRPPLLGELIDVGWVSIVDAGNSGYPAIELRKDKSAPGLYTQFALAPPQADAQPTGTPPPLSAQTPLLTPWRVLLIADDRGSVMASGLVGRLSAISSQP